jgi:hypothetical protein
LGEIEAPLGEVSFKIPTGLHGMDGSMAAKALESSAISPVSLEKGGSESKVDNKVFNK